MIGVSPFERDIDEENNKAIVAHDLGILLGNNLKYVLLKSVDDSGNLSTGTACEMMVAQTLGKPVVVLVEEGHADKKRRIHPFTEHYASYVADNIRDAVRWIADDVRTNGGLADRE